MDPQQEDKVRKLQAAYDEFMAQVRSLEHERTEVMKKVISELEREEMARILDELKH